MKYLLSILCLVFLTGCSISKGKITFSDDNIETIAEVIGKVVFKQIDDETGLVDDTHWHDNWNPIIDTKGHRCPPIRLGPIKRDCNKLEGLCSEDITKDYYEYPDGSCECNNFKKYGYEGYSGY